ncbi:hypothetical protein B1C78_02130 [Thioalkalivibrio denitrificans]|uniref:Glycosyl hydrolase n=1 Tax=Thioalkalivibrio denitrificans TaxID=108003 RepID=A0A1V3NT48_9GAMM|nr:hypothetical protein [Thioalkalivibrio denitrificans]OOG28133.1 hypothetical protein B1C78_02130 [Thioalkalivibrio denitrificans]
MFNTHRPGTLAAAALACLIASSGLGADTRETTTISALAERTHFHGIAVARHDPSLIYLATHHGLYGMSPDGGAWLISDHEDDLMGFTTHPQADKLLFASGHPAQGGNLGFIVSDDAGRSWEKRADGVDGPVDFHQMDVSKADPDVIYGVYRGLQRSTDGGHSWERVGRQPDGLISLAASARDVNTVYAATQQGLWKSTDAGRSWTSRAHPEPRPVSKVHVTDDGQIQAFIVGVGLVRASENDLEWEIISRDFGPRVILHMDVDPADPDRMYAVMVDTQARQQSIWRTRDGGRNWSRVGVS